MTSYILVTFIFKSKSNALLTNTFIQKKSHLGSQFRSYTTTEQMRPNAAVRHVPCSLARSRLMRSAFLPDWSKPRFFRCSFNWGIVNLFQSVTSDILIICSVLKIKQHIEFHHRTPWSKFSSLFRPLLLVSVKRTSTKAINCSKARMQIGGINRIHFGWLHIRDYDIISSSLSSITSLASAF